MAKFEHGQTKRVWKPHMIFWNGGNDFMFTSFEEICGKEIINTVDGSSFGFPGDIIFDTETRKITALVIKGKTKIFGKKEDFSVSWDKIETIGKDTILIKTDFIGKIHNEKESFLKKILNFFLY